MRPIELWGGSLTGGGSLHDNRDGLLLSGVSNITLKRLVFAIEWDVVKLTLALVDSS